ncbi:hypothetical protein BUALT_Bualt13G0018600 [Buddleja alternifolia]|uniref:LOB domain-containing protein n=1 Tax=Buddleja alternifolia TaxID=168488 RepID=A0AAV6WPF2_9LAMI|nr:hypothetical protein BUALT_Bualt13G0018600 [Buddleja alternifolia]
MTGGFSNSPCGACKFLRKKCVKGCVFAPHFSHENGADYFAAIHKVFGASNVSKLLSHLPMSDRCEAAVTISYEAQARVQDPIYGCVSHIFALQQQVVNLQAQLASLKEQATQCIINNSNSTTNPNHSRFHCESSNSFAVDSLSRWHSFQNQGKISQSDENLENIGNDPYYTASKYENYRFPEENTSFGSINSLETQSNDKQWYSFQDDADELRSVAFRYIQHS